MNIQVMTIIADSKEDDDGEVYDEMNDDYDGGESYSTGEEHLKQKNIQNEVPKQLNFKIKNM